MLLEASNRLRISLEYSGLATRFLPEHFTLGQIQDIYEIIWEVELDPANFREKITNVEGWIKESKSGPKDAGPRRGKPPTWYKEHDIPQFDRMITNPNGAVIREKESEYQKNLDNLNLDFVNYLTTEEVFSKIRQTFVNSLKTELGKHDLNYEKIVPGFEKYSVGGYASSPLLIVIVRRNPEGRYLKTESSFNIELSIQKFKLKKNIIFISK